MTLVEKHSKKMYVSREFSKIENRKFEKPKVTMAVILIIFILFLKIYCETYRRMVKEENINQMSTSRLSIFPMKKLLLSMIKLIQSLVIRMQIATQVAKALILLILMF